MMLKKKAITLVETLVYLAIFGVFFAIVIAFMLDVSEANRRSLAQNEIERATLFLFNHMTDTFERASAIDEGSSTFDDPDGVLHLEDGSDDFIYRIDSDRVEFDEDGTENFLTIGEINVESLEFERVEQMDSTLVGARVIATLTSVKFPEVSREIESVFILTY